MPIVFDPDRVSRVLDALPALQQLLPPPSDEGTESVAFERKRVTSRALYRLLASPHYRHVRDTLRAINAAAAAGMSLKELRSARLRGEFGSFLCEVLIADHFLRRGLTVSKSSVGPDLEVVRHPLSATVEVYSPRNWQARNDWVNDVIDALKNADIPYEYVASVTVDAGRIPMTSDLLEDVILRTGRNVLERVEHDLQALSEATGGSTWTYTHEDGEMTTTIEFAHVAANPCDLVRAISTSPGGEVFQADKVFADVLEKVRNKGRQRQAIRGSGELKGLAVDLSRSGIEYELETGRLTLDPSTAGLELDDLDLDFIALTIPRRGKHGPTRGVRATTIFEDTRITKAQLAELFDL